jgi:hypothetical protein
MPLIQPNHLATSFSIKSANFDKIRTVDQELAMITLFACLSIHLEGGLKLEMFNMH